jgi:PTH1 family peptidyl-tRNA hydrolase
LSSVGNLLVESLARRLGIRLSHSRGAETAETTVSVGNIRAKITLYKSSTSSSSGFDAQELMVRRTVDTYMNVSGPPIARTLKSLGLKPANLLVLHDALDRRPEVVSRKQGGSANGHNGVRSVISALGTEDFARLRLGIGKNDGDAAEYVLDKLPSSERVFWGEGGRGVDQAWKAIEHSVAQLVQQ